MIQEDDAIIQAVARRMYMDKLKASGMVNPPADMYDRHANATSTGAAFVRDWEARARVAVRALTEHGPTQQMLDAYNVMTEHWRAEIGETVP